DAELAALDMCAVHDDEDRETRPHPAREQAVEAHVESRLLMRLAHRGLFRRLVIFDQTTREGPVAVPRTVIQTHQKHAAVALDDGVGAYLHVHEVGETADRTGRAVTAVDARRNESRAIARAEREARRAVDHSRPRLNPWRVGPSDSRWPCSARDPRRSAGRHKRTRNR